MVMNMIIHDEIFIVVSSKKGQLQELDILVEYSIVILISRFKFKLYHNNNNSVHK